MGFISTLADKKEQQGKLNTGQYGFKPWMANLIMGILEFVFFMGWFIFGFLALFASFFSFDLDIVEATDAAVTFVLIGLYLIWNLMVWFIQPLRTRLNYCETFWNLLFIAWLIYTLF